MKALLLVVALAQGSFQGWHAWLDSPGGDLPFSLSVRLGSEPAAFVLNGEERIEIPKVRLDDGDLVLEMPHYDSRIRASFSEDGTRMDGEWTKVGSGGSITTMGFHASIERRADDLVAAHPVALTGRWQVAFESSEDLSVAEFRALEPPRDKRSLGAPVRVAGTFLTTLGDYRFLVGRTDGVRFRLSCFDGAHAFLFEGEVKPDGTIEGDFWSRDTWHEKWTAARDPDAALPDPFGLTSWNEDVDLESLVFPGLDGKERSLADPAIAGKARIVELFGSWCPNCHDEAPYLAELDRRYRERGLRVVGLAFEHTGDFERDAEQVRTYARRHGIEFPILLAGTSDKKDASTRFPLVDRVRAFPTTIFMRGDGTVRAIHTGFDGPATGAEHEKLREDFERLIEELLEGE